MSIKDVVHTIPFDVPVKHFQVWKDIIIAAESQIRLTKIRQDQTNPLRWASEDFGTLLRNSHDRVSMLQIAGSYLIAAGSKSPQLESFYINSDAEAAKKRNKRLKKNSDGNPEIILRDLIRRGPTVKAVEEKIKSIDCTIEKDNVKVNTYP